MLQGFRKVSSVLNRDNNVAANKLAKFALNCQERLEEEPPSHCTYPILCVFCFLGGIKVLNLKKKKEEEDDFAWSM